MACNAPAGSDCGWLDQVVCSAIPLGEALDNQAQSWNSSGAGWVGQGEDAYVGASAARSNPMGDDQTATLDTALTGPASIRFYWKVSSQQGYDNLTFLIDGQPLGMISGQTDWKPQTADVAAGEHTLSWQYGKDGAYASGSDCGWVDQVRIDQGSLGEAVDNASLSFTSSGDALWFSQGQTWMNGQDAAQCGSLNASNQLSVLQTTLAGPGTLTFQWKEDNAISTGEIDFRLDGVAKTYCYNSDWEEYSLSIPGGQHLASWEYLVYGTQSDKGFVDKVVFTPSGITINEALDNGDFNWTTYGAANWSGQQDVWLWGADAMRSGPIGDDQNSFHATSVQGPGVLGFDWKVSCEANRDDLELMVENVARDKISGEVDWQHKDILVPAGNHLVWFLYYKNSSGAAGNDCGWVDHLTFTPCTPLGEALDNTSLNWNSSGSAFWLGQNVTRHQGGSAAQSGLVKKGQESILTTEVTGPANLLFAWKVSSQPWDNLEFYLDSQKIASINGLVDWEHLRQAIPDGTHTLKWRFAKVSPFSDNEDCAWVDQVIVTPGQASAGGDWTVYE